MKRWKPTTQIERGVYHDVRKALRIAKSETLLLDAQIRKLTLALYEHHCNWLRMKGLEEPAYVPPKLRESSTRRRAKLDQMRALYSERI